MKKIPYGISNYEELIQDGYYYVDKTEYIEKLEKLPEKRIMFLRPIMKEYYDGYKFARITEEKIYNLNMCLYLLADYIGLHRLPEV